MFEDVRGVPRVRAPSEAWGKMLRWRDGDGRQPSRHVADAMLHYEATTLCAQFADLGLRIARSRQRHFADYLSGARVKSPRAARLANGLA
jgi:hypothetical protein